MFFGPLAQLVEQETLNLLVVGSTPTRPTNFPAASGMIPPVQTSARDSLEPDIIRPRKVAGVRASRHCESGEIGRRAGFRYQWGNP